MQTATRLMMVLTTLTLSSGAWARPVSDPGLRQSIRREVKRTVQAMRGRPGQAIRGQVQQVLLSQLKAHRTQQEWQSMKTAGLDVPYRDVRSYVHREFDNFLSRMTLPSDWEQMSPGRRFGVVYRQLSQDFSTTRTFPSNWSNLDGTARYEVARCLAGNCSVASAPQELTRWLKLTGTSTPAAARPMTGVEQMLAVSAGGGRPAPKQYYGPETVKAAQNFRITGQRVPSDFIKSVAQIKAAAAITNMRTGRLDRKVGGAIVKAAREVIQGKHRDQFITDPIQGGAGTSVNMNVNEVIAARASEILTGRIDSKVVHPNDHVNMAQSTNDVYPTAARLTAYNRLSSLLASYELLASELEVKARQYKDLPKAGRTHLQDAVPVMLGREFGAYAAVLRRDMRDVKVAMKGLASVNMGATAVGTALNAEPAYVKNIARTLARVSRVPVHRTRDLVDGTQNVDAMARAHGVLKVSSSNLIKICNDLRMMNSGPRAGFGEITLPAVQKGSSIMPGKVNPVIAEVVNQIGYQVQGNDVTVNLVAQNGQFELNQMEPVMVHNVLQSIRILDRGARTLATKAIRGMQVHEQTCRTQAERMMGLATALAPELGYDKAAALAKDALHSGKSLKELVVERGVLSAERANKILDPARMARGGVLK